MNGKRRKHAAEHKETDAASGFVKGLTDLIEKLGDLAETGRELRRSGEFSPDEKTKAIYGLKVKLGLGGDAIDVEPFGNVKVDKKSRHAVVQEIREPLVDVIEEPKRLLVIAEMPGVSAGDISLSIDEDVMSIEAQRGDKKYRKELLLPKAVAREKASITCNNGIVQIECRLD